MPKVNTEPTEPTPRVCKDCGADRFQVHERGVVLEGDGTVEVRVDELAYQCLGCHHVTIQPVSGVVEYYK